MKKVWLLLVGAIVFMGLLTGCSNDKEEETKTDPNTVKVSKSIDDMVGNFAIRGKECKEVEDTLERGECFQSVHSKYLSNWSIDKRKNHFYYPMLDETLEETILYYHVDESGGLGEMQTTAYYDDFIEEKSVEASQNGAERLESYWYIFANMIPSDYRKDVKSIVWTNSNEYGFKVRRDEDNIEEIYIGMGQGIPDYSPFFRSVLLHEFAHVLTLDESQVNIDREVYLSYLSDNQELIENASAECPTYFFWGCFNESSYLYHYYRAFWEDIIVDHEAVDWNSKEDYKEFFMKYEDHFFNSYQGIHLVEDFAEAFTAFVVMDPEELEGQTEVKYEKVKFFYEYDELVELRTEILENIYDLSVKNEKFY